MIISFSKRALKTVFNEIMCYFMYDGYDNCNENAEIAIKTFKISEQVNQIVSLMFSQP